MVIGLPGADESEGFDRTHMNLPANQLAVLQAVAAVNPNVVVVLVNGSTVVLGDVTPYAQALVEAWLGGQAAGGGIADVLTGAVNPSGRLAETIPHRLEDNSSYFNFPGDSHMVRYGEGLFIGYRGYDKAASGGRVPVRLRAVLHHFRAVRPDRDHSRFGRRRHPGADRDGDRDQHRRPRRRRGGAGLRRRRGVDRCPAGARTQGVRQGLASAAGASRAGEVDARPARVRLLVGRCTAAGRSRPASSSSASDRTPAIFRSARPSPSRRRGSLSR